MDIYKIREQLRKENKSIYEIPLRAAFYARVSTTTETQQNSIENQISHFTNRIKSNPNWQFTEGYVDEVRGENVKDRRNFLRMVEDAKSGKFDFLFTKEISRFARDTADSLEYTRLLLSNGVCVCFENDNLNTIEADSELRLTIMSSIAQEEVRKLSERIKFGHRQAIKNNVVFGNSRIYGYEKDKGVLVINEKEAELVRKIFDLYLEVKSSREVERRIWDLGYRNSNGNIIRYNCISNIIKNPKYKGFYCGNKTKTLDYKTKQQIFLPKEDWKIFKDETGKIVPQIVSEEIWEAANEIMKEKSFLIKQKGRSARKDYVYSGKVFCGVHDTAFWRHSYPAYDKNGEKYKKIQWKCSARMKRPPEPCLTFPIFEYELNDIVKKVIELLADNDSDYIKEYIKMFEKTQKVKDTQGEIVSLKKEITKIQCKKDKLLELSIGEFLSNNEFSERNSLLNKEVEEIKNKILEIEKNKGEVKDRLGSLKDLNNIFKEGFDINDPEFIEDIVEKFISRITITPVEGEKNTVTADVILKTGGSMGVSLGRKSCSSVQITNVNCTELQLRYSLTKQWGTKFIKIYRCFNINLAI